jgi:hypothetical protein
MHNHGFAACWADDEPQLPIEPAASPQVTEESPT